MAVKVLIAREFKEEKVEEAYKLLMELRSLATIRNGYLSGQTIVSTENPRKLVVISTWASQKRWEQWYQDQKRKDFTKKLEPFLTAPEQVEVFLVGEKHAEWVDMA